MSSSAPFESGVVHFKLKKERKMVKMSVGANLCKNGLIDVLCRKDATHVISALYKGKDKYVNIKFCDEHAKKHRAAIKINEKK
jgi:hypothetical protein